MKKLTREYLRKIGVPAVLIPGLLLAVALGWNGVQLSKKTNYFANERIFPRQGVVVAVEDGDTLQLVNGVRVRLLGINTPERGAAFYNEAKQKTADLVAGRSVSLEYEPGYQDDKFGRVLAYAWYSKEGARRLLNEDLVAAGLARTAFYKDRRKLAHADRLAAAEASASAQRLYLFAPR